METSVGALARCVVGLVLGLAPSFLAAQTVRGTIVDDLRSSVVSSARIIYVNPVTGAVVAEVESNADGRFTLPPPETGEYQLQISRLGYEPYESPLLRITRGGSDISIEFRLTPAAIGLEGLEVAAERSGSEILTPLGLNETELGARWIDRQDIEAMKMPGLPKDLIRWQNIPGLWVDEFDQTMGARAPLCVTFRQGRTCAITVLNGAVISPVEAAFFDPHTIEAIAILRPSEAMILYGTIASGGAVLFWSRQGRPRQ